MDLGTKISQRFSEPQLGEGSKQRPFAKGGIEPIVVEMFGLHDYRSNCFDQEAGEVFAIFDTNTLMHPVLGRFIHQLVEEYHGQGNHD